MSEVQTYSGPSTPIDFTPEPPADIPNSTDVKVMFRDITPDYEVLEVIGEGAYGVVVSAQHRQFGTKVAIKRINPFDHSMFCQRTLREIKLLKHFEHENIISIMDIHRPYSLDTFNEVYLVQELMETDLHRVIRTQELSDDHCQYFLYQTIRGLKAIHTAGVLHRDLKPSNLLLNANCDLKICDFGLARSAAADPPNAGPGGGNGFMTEYVATRWYRAPEVMLSFQEYSKAIDMWSVGCILAEMLNAAPIFPGRDYHHQLELILDVLGTPSRLSRESCKSQSTKLMHKMGIPFQRKQDLRAIVPNATKKGLDLLRRTLTFSPSKRITVEEALSHPYLEPYHDPNDEPSAPLIKAEFFEFEYGPAKKDRKLLKRLIYEEIMNSPPSRLVDLPK
ncbi:CMGC/MAPK protein kinase [Tremella mesenterica]|uniref:Mitogen-activated protein kinase n=1 Tax=Tremella mesenterica TaxID=5217 RepID=A0A4Q1BK30_TREME|nr:CMGC/MAPK protein kinase [Tremella mesenterica]